MPVTQTPIDAFDSPRDATDASIDVPIADAGVTCAARAPNWGLAGDRMFPGSDCLSCHRVAGSAGLVLFSAAGTVFSDVDCPVGVAGVTVTIEDHNGQTVTLTTNEVGNFFTGAQLVPPLRTRATLGGRTVEMTDAVTDGSCNSCHAGGDGGMAGYLSLGR